MEDDEELRRRLKLLREKFDDGQIQIAEHLADNFNQSFNAVRMSPDGTIDLSSVDGSIRSMALAVTMVEDRQEIKSAASLAEIQKGYFERISHMFDVPFNLMLKHGANPYSISRMMLDDEQYVEKNYSLIEPFISDLEEFWGAVSEPLKYHLQDTSSLKGVFGGEIFPSFGRNIASSTGLYLDTIVLSDPFLKSRELFKRWAKRKAVQNFVDLGTQVMGYKDLATADTDFPIVVILPFDSALDNSFRESLVSVASNKALFHASILFGRKFSEFEELKEFLSALADPIRVTELLADPSRLLFDTEWKGNPAAQITRAIEKYTPMVSGHPGQLILEQSLSRMMQATDVSWQSSSVGGVPLIDAPTSWQYYTWSLEYGAVRDKKTDLPLHVSRGMQRLANTDMQWLGDIPPDALIEMRKEGALDEIRAMLSSGVEEVANLNPDNFFRTADKVYDNIENAFLDHQAKINELKSKKWKFAGSDIGSWVVAGSIEVASAFMGTPAWGIAGFAVSQVTDAPKLKDIPKKASDLKRESHELSKSASGLLFKHKK